MKKILMAATVFGAALMTACGGSKTDAPVMGSLSDPMDSLSYSIGTSISSGLGVQFKDLPLNYDEIERGIVENALGKSAFVEDSVMQMLQNYFRFKAAPRMQKIMAERMHQDSVRMAAGDSTKVEYPADSTLFDRASERDSISYALGYSSGYQLRQSKLPIQLVWVKQAMEDARTAGATPKMTTEQANRFLQTYFTVTMPAQHAKESAAWLEKIAKKSGVKKTESGLLYKIEKQGDTTVMAKDKRDQVKVLYTGRTRNGDVFDTSYFSDRPKSQQEMMRKRNPMGFNADGTPKKAVDTISFPLGRVIKGWTEGMQLIGKGGKIHLWIPAELAYGPRGAGQDIGPNDALEFEVELVDVIPYVVPAPAAVDSLAKPAVAPAAQTKK